MEEYAKPGRMESFFLILAAFIAFVLQGVQFSDGILIDVWMNYFKRGSGSTAWLGSVGNGLTYAIAPVACAAARRFTTRRVYVAAGFAGCIAMTITSFSPNFYVALICKIVAGASYAFHASTIFPYIISRFKERSPFAIGCINSGIAVGGITYPLLINASLQTFGWRGTCLILGGLSCHQVPIGLMFRNWTPQSNSRQDKLLTIKPLDQDLKCNDADVKDISLRRRSTFSSIAQPEIFKVKMYVILLIHTFLLYLGVSIVYLHLVAGYRDLFDMSAEQARLSLSVLSGTNLLGRFLLPMFVQHKRVDTLTLYLIINALLSLQIAVVPLGKSTTTAMIFSASLGLLLAGFGGLPQLVIAELMGEHFIYMAYGYSLCFGGLGYLIGGPIAGWMYDCFDDYAYSFYFGGAIVAACVLVMVTEWVQHIRVLRRRETAL